MTRKRSTAFRASSKRSPTCCARFVLRAPPNLVEGFGAGAIREGFNALGTANILRGLSLEQQRDLLDLFTRSAGEMLDERFETIWSRRCSASTPSSAIMPAPTPRAPPM